MAASHAGALPMAASKCQCDPELKKAWGCEGSTQGVVWIDCDDTEYYLCPIRVINENTMDWYESYAYYQDHGGAPGYDDQSAKYVEAWKVYKHYYNHYTEEMMPKPKDGYANARQILKGNNNG